MHDMLTIVKRRILWILVPLAVSVPIGIWNAKTTPKVYSASTVVLIESPNVPKEYVVEPESSIEVTLSKISQEIMERDNIEKIIQEFGLFSGEIPPTGITDSMILTVRDSISIDTMRTDVSTGGRKGSNLDAFVLTFEGPDPKGVTDIVNRLAQLFVEKNQKRKEQFVESSSTILDAEVNNLKEKLEQQETEISDFKREFMGELPEQLGANLRLQEKYEQDLAATMNELKMLEEKKALLEKEMQGVVAGTSVPESLEARLAELKDKLLLLQGTFKENYPDVIATKQEIQLLESLIAQPAQAPEPGAVPGAVSKLQTELYTTEMDIKALNERQAELTRLVQTYQQRVDKAPVREQQLLSLMRDYDNTMSRYRSLLDRKLTVEISDNIQRQLNQEDFRIFEPASVPTRPIRPDAFKIILTMIAYGAAAGAGLAAFKEYSDTSFHKTGDLEAATGLRVLCSIPRFTRTQMKNAEAASRKQRNIFVPVFVNDPQSVAAEQYRFLCGRIQQHFKGAVPKSFGITSAVLGEGKSTTALNLAMVFATDFRKKTVLIDADLQKPADGHISVNGKKGLVEVLRGELPLESALLAVPPHNLTVLPKGDIRKGGSIELLGQNRLEEIVRQLKGYFEYVLVDCPPALQVASTGLITDMVDGLIFVVGADETPRDIVMKAQASLEKDKIIGLVFNNVKYSEMAKKYYHYYSYTNV